MAWTINGTGIDAPDAKDVAISIQKADHRTLDGSNGRDYIGDQKLVVTCEWETMRPDTYTTLYNAYAAQQTSGTAITLAISDLGLTKSVILDFPGYTLHIPNQYDYRKVSATFIEV